MSDQKPDKGAIQAVASQANVTVGSGSDQISVPMTQFSMGTGTGRSWAMIGQYKQYGRLNGHNIKHSDDDDGNVEIKCINCEEGVKLPPNEKVAKYLYAHFQKNECESQEKRPVGYATSKQEVKDSCARVTGELVGFYPLSDRNL